MRHFMTCIFAAAALVVLMDAIASPLGQGPGFASLPLAEGDNTPQVVDRTKKSDRLKVPRATDRRPPLGSPVLMGCEPVFSALSTGKRSNFAGRCVS